MSNFPPQEPSLQLDGVVVPSCAQLSAPNLMRPLMLALSEVYRRSEPHVKVPHVLECFHELLRIHLWPGPFQRLYKDTGGNIVFE